ncbi:sulfatase family protein [Neorhodopirellula pilleata]|uniref:Arylsulfatase n=1 Tax=Neorhodopirellula pilleata TaxID=2714738 RepID=A0A5C6A7S4_9BACT|nr:sulfatase [Neorhodopirellula pilleata]TWT95131.1 Arylsulfatase [Neorhodopirellula pilleata]
MRTMALPLVASLVAASFASAAERNVLFIITDDESPTLGCYGDTAAVTPAIDAVAADGVVFRNAFATTASCSASRSVVMSGLHNHRNGQFGHQHHYHKFSSFNDVAKLALPRVMTRAGYRTGHIGKYHVAPESVYHYETYLKDGNGRNAVAMADKAKAFLTDTTDDRPFFLYFATSDPHRGGGIDQTSPLEMKPDLFGNKKEKGSHAGVEEVFFDPADVIVPAFLPDTPETRSELAQYYQSCARVDQGVARLVEILREADLYDKTMILFTSDHGMAFAGGKTTVYEGGLRVPMVVRDPYQEKRGVQTDAMISHIDITPTLLDFAGGLDNEANAPKDMLNIKKFRDEQKLSNMDNHDGHKPFDQYHGRSWLPVLADPELPHHDEIFASHTFHEIQMYYPMRVVRDDQYKLIWNIAHPLPYPFASDLWAASSWQAQLAKGNDAPYGQMTVGRYVQRPEFELFNIAADPHESTNLATSPGHADILEKYQAKLKSAQRKYDDPWIMKWDYE